MGMFYNQKVSFKMGPFSDNPHTHLGIRGHVKFAAACRSLPLLAAISCCAIRSLSNDSYIFTLISIMIKQFHIIVLALRSIWWQLAAAVVF